MRVKTRGDSSVSYFLPCQVFVFLTFRMSLRVNAGHILTGHYYLAQYTSGQIWLAKTRHMPFRKWSGFPVSSAIMFTKEQRKKTLKNRKKLANLVS